MNGALTVRVGCRAQDHPAAISLPARVCDRIDNHGPVLAWLIRDACIAFDTRRIVSIGPAKDSTTMTSRTWRRSARESSAPTSLADLPLLLRSGRLVGPSRAMLQSTFFPRLAVRYAGSYSRPGGSCVHVGDYGPVTQPVSQHPNTAHKRPHAHASIGQAAIVAGGGRQLVLHATHLGRLIPKRLQLGRRGRRREDTTSSVPAHRMCQSAAPFARPHDRHSNLRASINSQLAPPEAHRFARSPHLRANAPRRRRPRAATRL